MTMYHNELYFVPDSEAEDQEMEADHSEQGQESEIELSGDEDSANIANRIRAGAGN